MSDITIYHNPRCGTSRNTLAMIRNSGVEPTVIEYLKTPPSREQLVALIAAAGLGVRGIMRAKEAMFSELGLADPAKTDGELIEAIMTHPILINRPIVVTPLGTRLCRPSELVLDILPQPQRGAFTKEDGEKVVDANGPRVGGRWHAWRSTMPRSCLLEAWAACQGELLGFLRHHAPDGVGAEDLLHDLFLRALRQDSRFCQLNDPRAWLFEVARNLVTDQLRRRRETVTLPVDLVASDAAGTELDEVDRLSACLPRVLSELCAEDRESIELCDIGGMTQARFAQLKGLSLPGAKSRIQRARRRLRARLLEACQIAFDPAGNVCCFVPRP
ncbi:arsenate reductase (glutaredoxin) [Thauera mechernichensis]